MAIKLKIITPETLFIDDKEVDQVYLQTTDGDMTVLKNHAPLVSTLKIGTVWYSIGNEKTFVHVHRGIVKISQEQVKILTDSLYLIDEQGNKIDTPKSI